MKRDTCVLLGVNGLKHIKVTLHGSLKLLKPKEKIAQGSSILFYDPSSSKEVVTGILMVSYLLRQLTPEVHWHECEKNI